jgi:hypothetical protein
MIFRICWLGYDPCVQDFSTMEDLEGCVERCGFFIDGGRIVDCDNNLRGRIEKWKRS